MTVIYLTLRCLRGLFGPGRVSLAKNFTSDRFPAAMKPGDQRPDERAGTSATPDPRSFGAKPRSFGSAAAGAGFQFAASIIVFLYLGQWLDRRLGTAPVFLLGCVFVGAGAAYYSMSRQLTAAQQRDAERRRAEREAAEARRAAGTDGP